MKKIATFHKVSFDRYKEDWADTFGAIDESILREIYDAIRLPRRATTGSAGYDFFLPMAISLRPGESVIVPTGVRVDIEDGWVLQIYPRSGLGFRYRLQMNNTVGIIDSDYFYSDNEGHIFVKLINDSREHEIVELPAGNAFVQGLFVSFGITTDDEVEAIRNGGIGSTDARRQENA